MSSTSTKVNRNRGTVKPSVENQNCRKNVKKDSGKQKISKFFTKASKNEDLNLPKSSHKNCLTHIKSTNLEDSSSDLDAFKTPKAINKMSKISSKPPTKPTKHKKTKQIPLMKFVEDNLKHSDVNPEHLQLALALSASSYEAENPNESPSSQCKRESFKDAFEKFGFGYAKNQLSVVNKKITNPIKNKKSRYRFVTPILKIRTQEEREELFQSKISLILAQNNRRLTPNFIKNPPKFINQHLQKLNSQKLYSLNSLELEELNSSDRFYVSGLPIERSSASCGCLLKDWRQIPGCEDDTKQSNKCDQVPPTENNSFKESNKNHLMTTQFNDNSEIETTPNDQINNKQNLVNKDLNSSLKLNSSNLSVGVSSERSGETNLFGEGFSGVKSLEDDIIDLDSSDSEENPNSCLTAKTNILSPNSSIMKHSSDTPSKYRLSPDLITETDKPEIQITPNSRCKRPRSCISPDLFESDEEPSLKVTPVVDRIRGGCEETECFDLTQSVYEETSHQIKISKIEENSDLNVTDYVHNLLTQETELWNSPKKIEKISTSEDEYQDSQNVIYISDDELNYSSVFSSPFIGNFGNCVGSSSKKSSRNSSDKYNWSDDDFGLEEMSLAERINRKSLETVSVKMPSITQNFNSTKLTDFSENYANRNEAKEFCSQNSENINLEELPKCISPRKYNLSNNEFDITDLPLAERITIKTKPPQVNKTNPLEDSLNEALNVISAQETPSKLIQNPLIIKTKNVTPMVNYDEMDTPKIIKELDKFGLKPLKRSKGAKLLKYIYESTHPIVGENTRDSEEPKLNSREEIIDNLDDEIGNVILEKKQSKKVASCLVPLHIVWYNFIMSNPKIRENILLYEPLQLEVLHCMLKEQGFNFNIQDLLTFLDKKCITIRTAQGQHKRKKT